MGLVRTERNRSPQQLWIIGLQAMSTLDQQHEGTIARRCTSQLINNFIIAVLTSIRTGMITLLTGMDQLLAFVMNETVVV